MSDSEGTASPLSSCGGGGEGEGEGGGGEWPVTKEWLEGLLTEYHGGGQAVVDEFELRPGCASGEGVLSDILAVTVQYRAQPGEPRRELDVIVKLLPQDPFSRFFVTEAQFDLREIKFYTQVRAHFFAAESLLRPQTTQG